MLDLSDLPIVDNHVHPWRATSQHLDADQLAGEVAFSQSVESSVPSALLPTEELAPKLKLFRDTHVGANYLRRELASFLGVGDRLADVLSALPGSARRRRSRWRHRVQIRDRLPRRA